MPSARGSTRSSRWRQRGSGRAARRGGPRAAGAGRLHARPRRRLRRRTGARAPAHLEAGEVARRCRLRVLDRPQPAVPGRARRAARAGSRGRSGCSTRDGEDCVERGYLLIPVLARADGRAATPRPPTRPRPRLPRSASASATADLSWLARDGAGARAWSGTGGARRACGWSTRRWWPSTSGELSPIVTGIVYCNTIAFCRDVYELRRAREWTEALTRWCEQQPEMVAHNGLCLVHRAEIMQLRGAWEEALEEARRAAERFTRGVAQRAGLRQGRTTGRARSIGCGASSTTPRAPTARRAGAGASRSRAWRCCAWRRATVDAAAARSAGRWARRREPLERVGLLPAYVEIMLAAGELERGGAAPAASSRRSRSARASDVLGAIAAHARGAVAAGRGRRPGARWPRCAGPRSAWQRARRARTRPPGRGC